MFPADHQRTRLTHALEVAQVATGIARALPAQRGPDRGHRPRPRLWARPRRAHASEDALGIFLPDGFDHAVWGADVSLAGLNLCDETLDGIRNHSWSRPAPGTPEGEVVSWADRIAYVCHDWEDAVSAGIVTPTLLPDVVLGAVRRERSKQLRTFIEGTVGATLRSGRVGMDEELAEALAAFRRCNYEHIYLRPASVNQGTAVVAMLRALVAHFTDQPNCIPGVRSGGGLAGGSDAPSFEAVAYVAGMTDRFAMAHRRLGPGLGPRPAAPRGVD